MEEQNPSEAITRWRIKNATVEAVQWTGDNIDQVYELTGCHNFDVLEEADRANCDDPEATASLYSKTNSTWKLVKTGDWVVKGFAGVLFPVGDEKFRRDYEPDTGTPVSRDALEQLADHLVDRADALNAWADQGDTDGHVAEASNARNRAVGFAESASQLRALIGGAQ
jgi:hypothetical protein